MSGEFIEKKVLSDKLWMAVEANKKRYSEEMVQGLTESAFIYRGKWLAFAEVALFLDGAFEPPKLGDAESSAEKKP